MGDSLFEMKIGQATEDSESFSLGMRGSFNPNAKWNYINRIDRFEPLYKTETLTQVHRNSLRDNR